MLKSLMFFGAAMALLFLPGVLQGQETTPEASPFRLYRHEIGIGASIPFNSDRGVVLLYKHRLGKVQQKNERTYQWALRCMLTHDQNDYDFRYTEGMAADTFFQRRLTGTNLDYDLGIGIERQQMRNRWRFYYGADLLFGWSNRPVDIDHLAIIDNGYTSNTLEFSFWIPRLLYLSHHFGG